MTDDLRAVILESDGSTTEVYADRIVRLRYVFSVPRIRKVETTPLSCPVCWHPHLDYDDEPCVSCGCEWL